MGHIGLGFWPGMAARSQEECPQDAGNLRMRQEMKAKVAKASVLSLGNCVSQ